MIRMPVFFALLAALALGSLPRIAGADLPPLVPGAYGDFHTYTFAVTWQPGICGVNDRPPTGAKDPEMCATDQPHTPLIGLHGLWPSLPQSLIDNATPISAWFGKGCDLLHHGAAPPAISDALHAQLFAVMPHFKDDLLTHEYVKHVQCFNYDPAAFFQTALAMRALVEQSAFGRFLIARTGRTVMHADVIAAFESGFGTTAARSVQLVCSHDSHGAAVLTQVFITIAAPQLAAFPAARSLLDTAPGEYEDSCPATFLLPSW